MNRRLTGPLDLDADAAGVGDDVGFLDPHPHRFDSRSPRHALAIFSASVSTRLTWPPPRWPRSLRHFLIAHHLSISVVGPGPSSTKRSTLITIRCARPLLVLVDADHPMSSRSRMNTRQGHLGQQDHIVLAHLLDRLPGALEARRNDEGIARLDRPALALVIGQYRLALDEMAEFPFGVVDLDLAGRGFPDAAIKPVVFAGKVIPGLCLVFALDQLGGLGGPGFGLGRRLARCSSSVSSMIPSASHASPLCQQVLLRRLEAGATHQSSRWPRWRPSRGRAASPPQSGRAPSAETPGGGQRFGRPSNRFQAGSSAGGPRLAQASLNEVAPGFRADLVEHDRAAPWPRARDWAAAAPSNASIRAASRIG